MFFVELTSLTHNLILSLVYSHVYAFHIQCFGSQLSVGNTQTGKNENVLRRCRVSLSNI